MNQRNKRWTPDEDRQLLVLRAAGVSLQEIAARMQRTQSAVDGRTYTLKARASLKALKAATDDEGS